MVCGQSMSAGRGRRCAHRPGERAVHRVAGAVVRCRSRSARTRATTWRAVARVSSGSSCVELDQQRDEVQVGFDRLEQLGFEQQLTQVVALDGVALEHLHDRRREVAADVAEPARDGRRRPAEPAAPTTPALPRRAARRREDASYTAPSAASMRRSSPAAVRRCRRPRRRRAPSATDAAARPPTPAPVTGEPGRPGAGPVSRRSPDHGVTH
jgi:hypothetical protein